MEHNLTFAFIFFEGLHQHVDVIGHHAPRQQAVTLAIEIREDILYDSGNRRPPQPARAVSRVHVAFDVPAPFQVRNQPQARLALQPEEYLLGYGVVQAEGEGLIEPWRVEMG